MFETTLGGTWFRWAALDRQSRTLAGLSFGLAAVAGAMFGVVMKPVEQQFGLEIAPLRPVLAPIGVAFALASAWLWFLFSKRQDEMFKRVQNWAIGMAGAWTCATVGFWVVLARTQYLPPVSAGAVALCFAGATGVFWLLAVRKWVS